MAQAPHKPNQDDHSSEHHDREEREKRDQQERDQGRDNPFHDPPGVDRPPFASGKGAWDAEHPGPLTTQTDQLVRSREMEVEGPRHWMERTGREIAERQGDAPDEPRQVHGVAPAQRPTR